MFFSYNKDFIKNYLILFIYTKSFLYKILIFWFFLIKNPYIKIFKYKKISIYKFIYLIFLYKTYCIKRFLYIILGSARFTFNIIINLKNPNK